MNYKSTLRKILFPIGVCWFITLFILGFLAYLTHIIGPNPTDGLGRPLTESPRLMRIILGQEKLWAGGRWFLIDMVVFWGSVLIASLLGTWLDEKK